MPARPDFRNFKGSGLSFLSHSAKGEDWKDHKYVDKVTTASGKVRYIYEQAKSKVAPSKGTASTSVKRAVKTGTTELGKKAGERAEAKMEEVTDLGLKIGFSKNLRRDLTSEEKAKVLNSALFSSEPKIRLVKELQTAIGSGEIGRGIFMFDKSSPNEATVRVDGFDIKIPINDVKISEGGSSGKDLYVTVPGTNGYLLRIADNGYGYEQYKEYQNRKSEMKDRVSGIKPAAGKVKSNK